MRLKVPLSYRMTWGIYLETTHLAGGHLLRGESQELRYISLPTTSTLGEVTMHLAANPSHADAAMSAMTPRRCVGACFPDRLPSVPESDPMVAVFRRHPLRHFLLSAEGGPNVRVLPDVR